MQISSVELAKHIRADALWMVAKAKASHIGALGNPFGPKVIGM